MIKLAFNILQVMNYGAAYPGNLIRCVKALEERIAQDGGKIVYVFPKRAEKRSWVIDMKDKGENIVFLNYGIFSAAKQLRKLIRQYDINIIHSHFMNYRTYLPIRLARAFNKGIPHIVHAHSQPKREAKPFLDYFRRKIMDEEIFICVSEAVAQEFSKRGHMCVTVKNGIDFTRLDSYCEPKREEYINRPDDKLLLMFGYDFNIKGIDIAIKSLQKYDLNHNIVLLICVASHLEEAKEQIIEICGEIPDWIRLLPPREDIATYYRLADAFVSASRSEGFNISLVEAAYCSIPIAATDIPGQNELKIPFTIEFESENKEQFFEAVNQALSIGKVENCRNNAVVRDYVINSFSIENWEKEIVEAYKNCNIAEKIS